MNISPSDEPGGKRFRAVKRVTLTIGLLMVCCFALLKACNTTEIVWQIDVPSPDKKLFAIAQTTQTGGGPTSAEWTEVFLATVDDTRDKWDEVAGFESDIGVDHVPVRVRWLSPHHLELAYKAGGPIHSQVAKLGATDITFVRLESSADMMRRERQR